jgi:hypothetical protein
MGLALQASLRRLRVQAQGLSNEDVQMTISDSYNAVCRRQGFGLCLPEPGHSGGSSTVTFEFRLGGVYLRRLNQETTVHSIFPC